MTVKVAVIGAGIGGIAVAIRLAAKGYQVNVFEKNDRPGGKMSEIRYHGYRFDTGPSLFTQPELMDELYSVAGEDHRENFRYKRLEEVCRYFFKDGMIINAHAVPEDFARELNEKAGEDPEKVLDYLNESRVIYDMTEKVFIRNSLHKFQNYISKEVVSALFRLHKIKPFSTLHAVNSQYFKHKNTVSIFDRFATYNGSDPYQTPATLMVIPHLEHNLGAYFPVNGMYDIASSLVSLGIKTGIKFHFNCPVEEIVLQGKTVKGVKVRGGEFFDFDLVVSDVDIWHLYRNLLKSISFPKKWFRHQRSTSALIFYWGMEISSSQLSLHNILFSGNYKDEFNCLFNLKTISSDPTVYVFVSKKTVSADAPDGCENWFVMVNAPENVGQDWDGMIAETRNTIEKKIMLLTGIEVVKSRKFEFVLDPRGIEAQTASYRGSLYGNSSNSMFSAFQRHPNFSKIKGLYLTGGSVHPGGGIPLCLSSAKIVADMIPDKK